MDPSSRPGTHNCKSSTSFIGSSLDLRDLKTKSVQFKQLELYAPSLKSQFFVVSLLPCSDKDPYQLNMKANFSVLPRTEQSCPTSITSPPASPPCRAPARTAWSSTAPPASGATRSAPGPSTPSASPLPSPLKKSSSICSTLVWPRMSRSWWSSGEETTIEMIRRNNAL